jgi:hypothetical protein
MKLTSRATAYSSPQTGYMSTNTGITIWPLPILSSPTVRDLGSVEHPTPSQLATPILPQPVTYPRKKPQVSLLFLVYNQTKGR